MALDAVTYAAAKSASKRYTDSAISTIPSGYTYKGTVSDASALPLSGNAKGDMYITQDNGHEWVWSSDSSSGTINDWADKSADLDNKINKPEDSENNNTLIFDEAND